jgi:hypothetical protein
MILGNSKNKNKRREKKVCVQSKRKVCCPKQNFSFLCCGCQVESHIFWFKSNLPRIMSSEGMWPVMKCLGSLTRFLSTLQWFSLGKDFLKDFQCQQMLKLIADLCHIHTPPSHSALSYPSSAQDLFALVTDYSDPLILLLSVWEIPSFRSIIIV